MTNERTAIESLFSIQTKEGEKVPFKLNKAQGWFDDADNAYGRRRIIIAKARQKGFSSVILAKLGIRCLGKSGTHAACVSHEASATTRLLDKVNYYMKHIEGPPPIFGRHSRTELYFEKTESTYFIGTAGAKAFGRGDTITDLHCSEYAWWEDPIKHSAGMFQAVPYKGRIYIESTGNGKNNDFYYIWQHAEDMGFDRLFYPWFADVEYMLPTGKSWKPDLHRHNDYLLNLKRKHGLSDQQMHWYELKLKELREDLKLMQQEYPSEPEECFQATGGAIFPDVVAIESAEWVDAHYKGYQIQKLAGHPKPEYNYVLGADPSGGTGNDDAAITVFCCETAEQVLEMYNNNITPFALAQIICDIGYEYNVAFIITEANNHGAAVVPYIKDNYQVFRVYKRKLGTRTSPPQYGWINSQISKHAMIGLMQEELEDTIIYGKHTWQEVSSFEEDKHGKMGSKSDNLVIAVGLAMMGLKRFEHLRREYLKPIIPTKKREKPNYMVYTFENVMEDINKQRKSRINCGVGSGYPN